MFKTVIDNLYYLGIVQFKNIPRINGSQAALASTVISALNLSVITFNNVAPVTVVNFIGGIQYQAISLKGDGQTTIANNASIVTNTGADKLLAVNRLYEFILIDEVWIEK